MKYLDKDGVAYLWGQVKSKIGEVAKDVYDANSSVSISANPWLVEKGVDTKVTVYWKSKYKGADVTPISTRITQSSSVAATQISTANNSQVDAQTKNGTKFTITSEVKTGVTKTASTSLTEVYPMYFGGSAKTTLTSADVTALGKRPLATSPDTPKNGTEIGIPVTGGQYLWLCVPDTMTITSIKSSGYGVPHESAAKVAVTGKGNYNCYRTSSPIGSTQTMMISINN